MPLTLESTDFLSHIDPPLSDATRQALINLVQAEGLSDNDDDGTTLHPLVNTSYTPTFSPAIITEHERIASGAARPEGTGIDLTRYEADALEPPANRSYPQSDEERPEMLELWRTTLRRAYASSTYLSGRNTNLALLETYGKNAWLVGNSQLEAILRQLEMELAEAKAKNEAVAEERRARQAAVAAEMAALDESWRRGVGGVVEVQIAAEGLRREVLSRRMEAAGR